MPEYVVPERGVEVTGGGIQVVLDAFEPFVMLASNYLLRNGIGEKAGRDGGVKLDPKGWYSLEKFLRAWKEAAAEVGAHVVRKMGPATVKNLTFPPMINDVHTALQNSNIAYHMNHRKNGVPMFNPATGECLSGIGSYVYERLGPTKVLMRCDNCYPCAFDQGLLEALAQKFAPSARVTHESPQFCRAKGHPRCNYLVQWT